ATKKVAASVLWRKGGETRCLAPCLVGGMGMPSRPWLLRPAAATVPTGGLAAAAMRPSARPAGRAAFLFIAFVVAAGGSMISPSSGALGKLTSIAASMPAGAVTLAGILFAMFAGALVSGLAGFAFSAVAGTLLLRLLEPAETVSLLLVCSLAAQLL